MKTRKLRLLSALLALAMLFALMPTAAFAEGSDPPTSGHCGAKGNEENVTWSLDSDGTLTISGTGKMADYGKANNSSVYKIPPWDDHRDKITKLVVQAGVTSIGDDAFIKYGKLKSVELPEGLVEIGDFAFCCCGNPSLESESLGSIHIPSTVTKIGSECFSGCKTLKEVTFEPGSKLETISCESALKEKLSGVFGESKISVTHWNVNFVTDDKTTTTPVENNKKIVDKPADPTRVGWDFAGWYTKDASGKWADEAFNFNTPITDDMILYARWTPGGTCGAEGNNLTWTLDDSGTLTISGTGAMADYDIEVYGDTIAPWAKYKKNIKKVVIGKEVTTIGKNAFEDCSQLSTVELPQDGKLEKIGDNAFGYHTLPASASAPIITEIVIPYSVEEIAPSAFDHCTQLAKVTFASGSQLKTIGRNAFQYTAIEEVRIPASVEQLGTEPMFGGGWTFYNCSNLKKVVFESPSELNYVSNGNFSGCSEDLIICCMDETVIKKLTETGNMHTGNVDRDRIKPTYPTVTFDFDNGTDAKNKQVENGEKVTKPETDPTKDGYIFAGWYTKKDGNWAEKPFDFINTPITDNMILYARWGVEATPITPATELYPITIDYGTAYDAEGNPIEKAAAGDVVTIKADETALEGMTFERWEVRKGNVTLENDRAAKTSFTMPAGEVQLEAMYQAADANDSGWDAATVVTGAVIGTGTAILAYHIGMEVYAEQVLGKDVAVPRTRAEVALLAWQLAGSPAVNGKGEPLSEAAQAEKWAVESGLMQPDAEGNFNGTKKMSKWNALRTLDAAKKMG